MRYDVHAHAFHPKIADKVLAQLHNHYGITPIGSGMVDDMLARARAASVERVVVLSAATAPAQVIPANNWSMELKRTYPQLVPFGTLHPEYDGIEDELTRLKQAGIQGLKFHPEFQGFWMDDPGLARIVELAQDDFVFMFHVGDKLPPRQNPSCPIKLAKLAATFPKARIIAAHFGGYLHWKEAITHLAGTNVYMDTSSTLPYISDDLLAALWNTHPHNRFLFGSDYPLFDPAEETVRLKQRLGIDDAKVFELMQNANELFE